MLQRIRRITEAAIMKIAAVQMRSGANKQHNIERALTLVKRAARSKARFIALPEVFHYRGKPHPIRGLRDIAEAVPGESTKPFMALAKQYRAFILLGSLLERIPGSNKVYNTSVLIDPRGKMAAKYRKISLFDAVIGRKILKESKYLKAGQKAVTANMDKFKIGLSICYDLRFSSIYQNYLKKKCDILSVPSAFTHETGKAHWETLLRARAIEHLSYVIAPNQIGKDAKGVLAYGNSMIIDPWGKVLACASANKEQIIYAKISKKVLKAKRTLLPGIV